MKQNSQDPRPFQLLGSRQPVADESVVTQLLTLLRALRASPYRRRLALLAIAIVVVICANAAGQIRLNVWQRAFYDALEQRHVAAFMSQLLVFGGDRRRPARAGRSPDLVAGNAQGPAARMADLRPARPVACAQARLHAELRRTDRGQSGSAHSPGRAAPDRSHDHARDRPVAILAAARSASWACSGSFPQQVVFGIGDRRFTIPGYMVWCALAYSLGGSLLAWRVGRRLISLNAERYAREADLRFALVRVNEHADGIALHGGEADERRMLDEPVEHVVTTHGPHRRRPRAASPGSPRVTAGLRSWCRSWWRRRAISTAS